jgi:hypothetical protein
VYHLQLQKSLNTACAFNLGEAELSAILEPWSRGQPVELGERRWNPLESRLTVIEGPHLATQDLSMGRGWRAAERRGEDVTARMLARTNAPGRPSQASVVQGAPAAAPRDSVSGAPDAQLESLLGADPAALLTAWRLVAKRRPELSPSESLALAEQTLSSLDADPA